MTEPIAPEPPIAEYVVIVVYMAFLAAVGPMMRNLKAAGKPTK